MDTLSDSRILVTGGAGFIGSDLSRRLLDAGADVHVLDNFFTGRRDLVPEGMTIHEENLTAESLPATVEATAPDAIVHLAALHYIPYCNEHPEETFEVNVVGTRRLLEAARDLDSLASVVFASSAAVYPPRDGPNPEDSPLGPTDIYGRTKMIGEDLIELFHRKTGVATTVARLFNTYGPNETNEHVVPAVLDQATQGPPELELGNLTPRRDFVHVSDVSRAILAMLSEVGDGHDVFNVGTGEVYSVEEIVEVAREATGRDLTILQDEDRVRESDRPHLQADPSRLRCRTGWDWEVDFQEGVRRLVEDPDRTTV
jgi:UDP-glucose 4-epimerase